MLLRTHRLNTTVQVSTHQTHISMSYNTEPSFYIIVWCLSRLTHKTMLWLWVCVCVCECVVCLFCSLLFIRNWIWILLVKMVRRFSIVSFCISLLNCGIHMMMMICRKIAFDKKEFQFSMHIEISTLFNWKWFRPLALSLSLYFSSFHSFDSFNSFSPDPSYFLSLALFRFELLPSSSPSSSSLRFFTNHKKRV